MVDIQRILCPIDFSDASRHAVEHAVASAKWYGAQITVLHVYSPPQPLVPGPGMAGSVPVLPPTESQDVVEQVRRFCKSVILEGSPEIVVAEGNPAREIVRFAERARADLVVMGTHGLGGFERLFLGSVTEKVLRTTPCPVLTVPPSMQEPAVGPVLYKTILCPVDFSPASSRALEHALSIAKETDARVILVHVVEDLIDHSLEVNAHFDGPEYRRHLEQDALTRLKTAIPDEARTWCRSEERVVSGKAYREILRVVDETHTDLIVMGVHGRGAVDRWFFGSTTHHILREAKRPVLTVRAE